MRHMGRREHFCPGNSSHHCFAIWSIQGVQGILISSALGWCCAWPLPVQHSCAKGIWKALFHHPGRAFMSLVLPYIDCSFGCQLVSCYLLLTSSGAWMAGRDMACDLWDKTEGRHQAWSQSDSLRTVHLRRSSSPCLEVATFSAKPQSSVFQCVALRLPLSETPGEGLLNL